jgi:hypothetical protein
LPALNRHQKLFVDQSPWGSYCLRISVEFRREPTPTACLSLDRLALAPHHRCETYSSE